MQIKLFSPCHLILPCGINMPRTLVFAWFSLGVRQDGVDAPSETSQVHPAPCFMPCLSAQFVFFVVLSRPSDSLCLLGPNEKVTEKWLKPHLVAVLTGPSCFVHSKPILWATVLQAKFIGTYTETFINLCPKRESRFLTVNYYISQKNVVSMSRRGSYSCSANEESSCRLWEVLYYIHLSLKPLK